MTRRIALVFNRYRSDGGTERITQDALQVLAADAVQWYVITRQWGGPRPAHVRIILCRVWALGRVWRLWAFGRVVRRQLAQLSVDWVQSQIFLREADIYRADGGAFADWIVQRRRQGSLWQRLARWLSPYTRLKLRMERRMYAAPRLKAVICNSEMVRRDIQHHFPATQAKLHVIENGVDLAHFQPTAERLARGQDIRLALGLELTAHVLIFIGSGFERKGLATALRALARAGQDSHLLVLGRDSRRRWYQRLARRLGLAGRVHFLGPQTDTRPYLWAADVLIHPALYEAFGLVIIEALAAGVPVLASCKTGAGQAALVSRQVGQLHDALDEAGFARSIEHMAAAGTEDRQARRQACLAAARPFALEIMRDRLLAFYRGLDQEHG